MSNVYKPLTTEISAPTTNITATTVSDGRNIRVVNSSGTAYLLTMFAAGNTDSASMTIAGGETLFVKKGQTDKMFAANAAVKLTQITYPKG